MPAVALATEFLATTRCLRRAHLRHHFSLPKMSDSNSRAGKRTSAESEESSRKKARKEDGQEEKFNPYLAHMQQENGFDAEGSSPLAALKRRQTTAKQAAKIEDLSTNAFTEREHTQKYFQILQTRRDLPVSKQRYVTNLSDPIRP